jgi:hypothetical protein
MLSHEKENYASQYGRVRRVGEDEPCQAQINGHTDNGEELVW